MAGKNSGFLLLQKKKKRQQPKNSKQWTKQAAVMLVGVCGGLCLSCSYRDSGIVSQLKTTRRNNDNDDGDDDGSYHDNVGQMC